MFEAIKKFFEKREPLPELGFEPRFLEADSAPAGSVYVVMQNDDKTEIEFVAQLLTEYFGFRMKEAIEIAAHVHVDGSADIRVMSAPDADRITNRVHSEARNRGFPFEMTTSTLDRK